MQLVTIVNLTMHQVPITASVAWDSEEREVYQTLLHVTRTGNQTSGLSQR